ncbi:MAG: malate dehydrogenase [Roseovarius sp.]|nr:malate dehydrogenase [Roseovarius sp.]
MTSPRVIGAEHVEDARRRGRVALEVMPGDIVTALARESASRIGVRLVDGPLEKPVPPIVDGNTAMRRVLHKRSPGWVSPSKSRPKRVCRFAKIALVGGGGVGSNIAHLAAAGDMADEIAIVDVAPGIAAATAMDLNHASGITRTRARVAGGQNLELVAGADVVVVSAGRARVPGMSRADLIGVNRRVIHAAGEAIRTNAPEAIVIVVTNPLDEMTVEMLRATGFPRERVLGMAGTLDSSRYRNALAEAAGVPPSDVEAIALGSHGDEMAPVASLARIRGQPAERFLAKEALRRCGEEAVGGGARVVELKKTGSAVIAPAHSTIELLDHIRGARQGPVPVSIMLEGEYGISGVVLGVPAHLGRSGLVEVVNLRLSGDERAALGAAAEAIGKRLEMS